MNNNDRFNFFIQTVKETHTFWLLQAKEGLFAMLEDKSGDSYIPVWSTEDAAKMNIVDDWSEYELSSMKLGELIDWTRELDEDRIMFAVDLNTDGSMFPMSGEAMRSIFEDEMKSDKDLVGDEFFDEDWAEWDGDLSKIKD